MYLLFHHYLNFVKFLNQKNLYLFLKGYSYFFFILLKFMPFSTKSIYVFIYKCLNRRILNSFNMSFFYFKRSLFLKTHFANRLFFKKDYLKRINRELSFLLIEDLKFKVSVKLFLILRLYVIDLRFYSYIQFIRLIVNSSHIRKVLLKHFFLLFRERNCSKVFFQKKILLIDDIRIIRIKKSEFTHKIFPLKFFFFKKKTYFLLKYFYYNFVVRFFLHMYKEIINVLKTVKYRVFHKLRFESITDIIWAFRNERAKELKYILVKNNFNFLLRLINLNFVKYLPINIFIGSYKPYSFTVNLELVFVKFFQNISWIALFRSFYSTLRFGFFKIFLIRFIKRCKSFFSRLLIRRENFRHFIVGLTYEFLLLNWHFLNFKKNLMSFSPIYFFIVLDKLDIDSLIKKFKFSLFFNIIDINFDFFFRSKFFLYNFLILKDYFLFLLEYSFKYKLLFFFFVINDRNMLFMYLNFFIRYNNVKFLSLMNIKHIYNLSSMYQYIIFANEV